MHISELSDGNPGAINVLTSLALDGDPRGRIAITAFKSLGIRGSDIWLLYKDAYESDLGRLLRSVKSGSSEWMDYLTEHYESSFFNPVIPPPIKR